MSDLLELKHHVNDSIAWLKDTMTICGTMLTDQKTGEDIPWKEMQQVYANLDMARTQLEAALDPIKDVLAQEKERQDDLEDLWDSQPHGFTYHPKA